MQFFHSVHWSYDRPHLSDLEDGKIMLIIRLYHLDQIFVVT